METPIDVYFLHITEKPNDCYITSWAGDATLQYRSTKKSAMVNVYLFILAY